MKDELNALRVERMILSLLGRDESAVELVVEKARKVRGLE